jgi:hypothetical protein
MQLQHNQEKLVCFLLGNSTMPELYMPTFWNPLSVPSSHLPAYEDGTDRVFETSAYKIQTPGNYPEESIHHS